MKLFGQIVRTVVNVAVLPVKAAVDVVAALPDAADGKPPFRRTAEQIEKIKDEAQEEAPRG